MVLVSVTIEPTKNRELVFLPSVPTSPNYKPRVSLGLVIVMTNNETTRINLNSVKIRYGSITKSFPENVIFNPGGSWRWFTDRRISLPYPPQRKIVVELKFGRDTIRHHKNIGPPQKQIAQGSYLFPGKVGDLNKDEFWREKGRHAKHFSQIFAHDLEMVGPVNIGRKKVSRQWRGSRKKNENHFVWNKPVYAMADGEVLDSFDGRPDNPKPGEYFVPPPGYTERDGENIIGNFLHIRHEDDIVLYAHFKERSLQRGLVRGARVSAGQLLGYVGNSGNSTDPHLHIHAVKQGTPRRNPSFPLIFRNAHVRARFLPGTGPINPWVRLQNQGLPDKENLIWPSSRKPQE